MQWVELTVRGGRCRRCRRRTPCAGWCTRPERSGASASGSCPRSHGGRDPRGGPGPHTLTTHTQCFLEATVNAIHEVRQLQLNHTRTSKVYIKVKVTRTRLPSVSRIWSRFLAVSLQVTWVINPAVGCRYFPPGLQLPLEPLRGLLPISLLGKQRHDGCEQFA